MNQELKDNKIEILGVKINTFTKDQAIKKIDRFLDSEEKKLIVTPNPEFIMKAQRGKRFKNILNKADLAIPDGIGLLWASTLIESRIKNQELRMVETYFKALYYGLMLILYPKYCQKVIPERISGTDLVLDIAKLCEQKNRTLFLLGAGEGVSQACALKLEKKYPNLKIAGTYSGSPKQKYDEKIVNIIKKTKPDVLLVAYGHPKQEKWINRNLNRLDSVKLAMGVGGAFDFISSKVKRAPKIFRRAGLEWFYRVIKQPWRINRILTATWRFSREVVKYKLR